MSVVVINKSEDDRSELEECFVWSVPLVRTVCEGGTDQS